MLSQIMKKRGLTSRKLAEITGLNQRTIESYRSLNVEPSFNNGLKIAKALNVDPYVLGEMFKK